MTSLTQAQAHLAYIEHHAGLLEAENDRIAAQLSAGAAQLEGMVPATWQPPKAGPDDAIVGDGRGKPKIQMVDSRTGPLPADPPPPLPQPQPPQTGAPIKLPPRPAHRRQSSPLSRLLASRQGSRAAAGWIS